MGAFDAFLAVDWSGANGPRTGKDSIWISERNPDGDLIPSLNPPTRADAIAYLKTRISRALGARQRLLIGFDFAFGYPEGAAKHFSGKADWRALWQSLAKRICDGSDNGSNRFEVASDLNELTGAGGHLFWGCPQTRVLPHLSPRRDKARYDRIAEKRIVDTRCKGAQPVWKLAYTGSVGSQALLGIPRLQQLCDAFPNDTAIWPFETAFANDLRAPIVLAEIYPSILLIDNDVMPKDRAQVEAFTEMLSRLDARGELPELLSAPADLSARDKEVVLGEEGWIVGVGKDALLSGAKTAKAPPPAPKLLDYLRDPDEIYRRSFEIVEAEADLARFSQMDRQVAIRMIHACGQVEIAESLVFSTKASQSGIAALRAGKPVFCDSFMVGAGIIRKRLVRDNEIICTLDERGVAEAATRAGTTRSAAAVDFWDERLDGAIAVIGNAPTALFRLLERLDAGGPKPALIVGLPVGFVGAAESKAELIANSRGVPHLTLAGRRGGSAMASAAVNALAGLAWPGQ